MRCRRGAMAECSAQWMRGDSTRPMPPHESCEGIRPLPSKWSIRPAMIRSRRRKRQSSPGHPSLGRLETKTRFGFRKMDMVDSYVLMFFSFLRLKNYAAMTQPTTATMNSGTSKKRSGISVMFRYWGDLFQRIAQRAEKFAIVALVVVMPHLLAHHTLALLGWRRLYAREPPRVDVGLGHPLKFGRSRTRHGWTTDMSVGVVDRIGVSRAHFGAIVEVFASMILPSRSVIVPSRCQTLPCSTFTFPPGTV